MLCALVLPTQMRGLLKLEQRVILSVLLDTTSTLAVARLATSLYNDSHEPDCLMLS